MKKSILHILLLSIAFTISSLTAMAQKTNSMDYLKQQFPKLTALFTEELGQTHTHYIIAVDVSGSMSKYDATVTPVLQAFAMALPEGERVSVIPFGSEAKQNTPGLCLTIKSDEQRNTLAGALTTLYSSPSHTPEFKRNTDVDKAVAAINKAILNNKDADMNVVIILTDFLNDLPNQGEVPLTNEQLRTLGTDYNNLTDDTDTQVVAMRLPPAGSGKGYCLGQLQESVFNNQNDTRRFEIVDLNNDQTAIKSWFEQLSRNVMTRKLQGVIRLYNKREITPSLTTTSDFDGNLTAHFNWKPNKMYTTLRLGEMSTKPGSGFHFKNKDHENLSLTGDTTIQLGQIRYNSMFAFPFVHKFNEDLKLSLDLPTDFDSELQTLSIEKPFSNTTTHQDRYVWTFIFTWLTTAIIAALLIIYTFLVFKAIGRNKKEKFVAKITIRDGVGDYINETPKRFKSQGDESFKIGKNGKGDCRVDSDWNIEITKQKSNPLLFWQKPKFKCQSNGKAKTSKSAIGYIGRYGNPPSGITFECYDMNKNIVNTVRIVLYQ